jgi:hypothetical protein
MGFYRITLDHSHRGRSIQNVFHIEEETNLLTQETIGNIIVAHWLPLFDTLQWSGMVQRFVEVRRILVANPLAPTLLQPNRIGGGGGIGAEGNMAFKVFFRTDLAGKQHRGRLYVCGVAENIFDVGSEALSPTGISRMTTAVLAIRSKFCGGAGDVGLRLVIGHKDLNVTPTRVSNVLFSQRAHWLRSREPFHGI